MQFLSLRYQVRVYQSNLPHFPHYSFSIDKRQVLFSMYSAFSSCTCIIWS